MIRQVSTPGGRARRAHAARLLAAAAFAAVGIASPAPARAAAEPYPRAWSGPGPCDASPAFASLGAAPLSAGASFDGVYACGPRPGPDWTEPGVPAQVALYGDWQGFQCSELSSRFFYLAYGLYAAGDGSWIADDARARHPAEVQLVENNKGALPQVGDIVSLSTSTFGHTYVVIGAANVDATHGSEDVTVLEQNYSPSGVRTLHVRGWDLQDPGFRVLRWAHAYRDPWTGAGAAPPPGPPLTYASVTATSVTLDWSSWPVPTGVHEFDVYRDARYAGSTATGDTRFVDARLAPGTSHTYYVVAQGGTLAVPQSSPAVQVSTNARRAGTPPGDGAFVRTPDGTTWRIAGGSALRVYDWTPFGGPQPAVPIGWGAFHALPPAPADGTFLRIARTDVTYVVAGGAPMFVSDWAPYGGRQPAVDVNAAAIAAMPAAPADGTLLIAAGTANAFVVAGGAPLAITDRAAYGGARPGVPVDADTIAGMRQVPANGTFLQVAGSGSVYVVAGGAPLPVASWSPYGGPQPAVPVSPAVIAGMPHVPWDGTYLQVAGSAGAEVIAGGAPLAVTDWTPYGGPQASVLVPPSALAGLRALPVDGTFLQAVGTATAYAVSGGRVSPIEDWAPFGGPQAAVAVSPASIAALPETGSRWRDGRRRQE